MRTYWIAVAGLLLTSLALVANCGSPSSDPTGPDDDDQPVYQQVPCPALLPATNAGIPLDEIPLGALPNQFGSPVVAQIRVADDDSAGFAYIDDEDPSNLQLVVPIHPSGSLAGGPTTLVVTDGTVACAPIDFTVQPLPEAAGEFGAVVDQIQALLSDQAALLETTPQELRETAPSDLPPLLWPLAVTQLFIDHPDNDASLMALADGALPGEELDLLERVLARTGLRASLETAAADLRSTGGAHHASAPRPLVPTASRIEIGLCEPDVVRDAPLLDHCMALGAEAARRAEGISHQVSEDIQRAFGALAALEVPIADAVEAVLGMVFWTIYNERDKAAALLPSMFTSMTLEVNHPSFLEDEEAQGAVTTALVTATSQGWDLGAEIIAGVLQAVGTAQTLGQFTTGDDDADQLLGEIRSRVEAWLAQLQIDDLRISPQLFGPISVIDSDFSQIRVALGDAIEFISHTVYEPRYAGTAQISVRTKDGSFGGQQIAEQADVTVETIQLQTDPALESVLPEQQVTITVTVEKSMHPEMVEFDTRTPLQGDVTIEYLGGNLHQIMYTAPVSPILDRPDLVTVRHSATTGARGTEGVQDRNATTTIQFGGLSVRPGLECLNPGDTLRFTATVQGAGSTAVTWEASAGTISAEGLYTAPSSIPASGSAIITARSVSNPDLIDTAEVKLGCTCTFHAVLTGDHNEDIFARNLMVVDEADLYEFGLADARLADDGSGELVMLTFDGPFLGRSFGGEFVRGLRPGIPMGSTGTYELNGLASLGGAGFDSRSLHNVAPIWYDSIWEPLKLEITEFTETKVVGRIIGEVREPLPGEDVPTSFMSVSFSALTVVGTTTASNCIPSASPGVEARR